MRVRFRSRVVAALVAGALATGCVPEGQLFREDERLSIVSPEDRSEVTLPLTIEWDVDGFEIAGPDSAPATTESGYFAVYLDQSPVPPGGRVVEASEVFVTTRTSLLVEDFLGEDEEQHTATIVFVDTDGNRIGESAFGVTFTVVAAEESEQ